jgi:hypothetical protein
MKIDILTLFPEICRAPLSESMMKRALCLPKPCLISSYVWRRDFAKPDPRSQICRIVGNEREKEQRSHAEQNDGEDFVSGAVLNGSSHRAS